MDNPESFEILLKKYAGGRMPSLVDLDNPERGLISRDLLQIYQSGIRSRLPTPLGILLAEGQFNGIEEKWQNGNFGMNEWSKKNWSRFCKALRSVEDADKACERCDRRWAAIAEREGKVITYMCDHGMIDFAIPISVKRQVVAVIFCGQFAPEKGPIWNPELLQPLGVFKPIPPGEMGIDIWQKGQERIQQIAEKTGLSPQKLFDKLDQEGEVISPTQVEQYQHELQKVQNQISDLASDYYDFEKGKVIQQIRSRITDALEHLGTTLQDYTDVREKLSESLICMMRFFALDYALILSLRRNAEEVKTFCYAGLPDSGFVIGEIMQVPPNYLPFFKKFLNGERDPVPIKLRDYNDMAIMAKLRKLHKKSGQVVIVPLPAPLKPGGLIMVVGNFQQNLDPDNLSGEDKEAYRKIAGSIALVAEIVLLVEELDATVQMQAQFVEDVAHDIRTPIQNLIVEVRALVLHTSNESESIRVRANRLATQVRRLHTVSTRAWTLINIARGVYEAEGKADVYVYTVIMEHRKSLFDVAKQRDIEIVVDHSLENWPPVKVNATLLSQAILNLLDNAVKYSKDGTEIRVDGKRGVNEAILSFVSRGIQIREEEKSKIFDRYYRTLEAVAAVPAGTGIGLSIVKAFIDHCNGEITVNSVPVPGTRDYVTEFKLSIPWR